MKVALLLWLTFMQASAFAQDDHFCKTLVENNTSSPSTTFVPKGQIFKFYLTYFFNPKKLVQITPLAPLNLLQEEDNNSSKVLINLFQKISFTRADKLHLKSVKEDFEKLWQRFYESHSFALKNFTDMESCHQYVQVNDIESKLANINSVYLEQVKLIQKQNEAKSFKLLLKLSRSFRKKGWKILNPLSINEMHDILLEHSGSTILVVGHATSEGKIRFNDYDIPKSFFRNIQIGNLIIYTCYPKEVLKNYRIEELPNINNYFYPQISEVGHNILSREKIPLNSLRSVRNYNFPQSSDLYSPKKCRLNFPTQASTQTVFLNHTILGAKKSIVDFDCSLLKESNLLEVYSLESKEDSQGIDKESVFLNGRYLELKVFNSRITKKHIVSKIEFKLQSL